MTSHPFSKWDKVYQNGTVYCLLKSCLYLSYANDCKVSFIIVQHCRTHWPCWLQTLDGASSLTKTLISQLAPSTFASAFTLVTLALCVTCRRTVKETLHGLQFSYCGKWPIACFNSAVLYNHTTYGIKHHTPSTLCESPKSYLEKTCVVRLVTVFFTSMCPHRFYRVSQKTLYRLSRKY